jgi:hypothetical protein
LFRKKQRGTNRGVRQPVTRESGEWVGGLRLVIGVSRLENWRSESGCLGYLGVMVPEEKKAGGYFGGYFQKKYSTGLKLVQVF